MSVYQETNNGGLVLKGCALIAYKKQYHIAYAAGDIAYNVNKARKGVLEKIVIKQARFFQNKKTLGAFSVIYVDTFNALWNERDLVGHAQAKSLAEYFLLNLLEKIERLDKC